ncbi:MAG TPA: IPT/TIG domain-containing protein [Candidatus Acidoferrum sp.]|nr:IPT/TIG domain-containing protein [Candidatus Acidoferrum sp.]
MRVRWATTGLMAVFAILLSSCSSNSGRVNPVPALGCVSGTIPSCALSPSGITAGSQNFTLFISGSGLISTPNGDLGNSVAYWNGSPRPTVLDLNSSQLDVTIYASDVASAGQAEVQVINPTPGGGQSNFVTFFIHAPGEGDPVLTSISPNSTASGGKDFTLTVNGSNFAANDTVSWNGQWRTTTFVNSTQMTAAITSNDIATPGCGSVAVVNTTPGGASSVSLDVLVTGKGAPTDCTSAPSSSVFPRVVSLSAHGNASNGSSSSPAMSADGRFVAFYSNARNIVSGPSGNIFVRDTCLGVVASCKPHTQAIDLSPDGSAPNGEAGSQLSLSADGRFVAFSSYATNLTSQSAAASAAVTNLYIRDLCLGADAPAGCTPHTELVSVSPSGELGDKSSIAPSLSADGRFIAFSSWATSLVSGAPSAQSRVYVRDLCKGPSTSESCIPQTTLVPAVKEASAASPETDHPSISGDGRYVAFQEWVPRAGSSNLDSVVFLHDTCLSIDAPPSCVPSTAQISLAPDGQVLGGVSESVSVSFDGRFVAFSSQSSSGSSSSSASQAVYLRDTCLGNSAPDGCTASTSLIATAAASGLPYSPFISSAGRYVSFLVGAPDSDTVDSSDRDGIAYIYDTCFGATSACAPQARALTASAGATASAGLLAADKLTPVALSSDGRYAAFYSASHAAAQPTSGHGDVFQALTSH